MSTRTSTSELVETLTRIDRRFNLQGYEVDIMAGRPRIVTTRGRDISPRLAKSDMKLWLHGFEEGLDAR